MNNIKMYKIVSDKICYIPQLFDRWVVTDINIDTNNIDTNNIDTNENILYIIVIYENNFKNNKIYDLSQFQSFLDTQSLKDFISNLLLFNNGNCDDNGNEDESVNIENNLIGFVKQNITQEWMMNILLYVNHNIWTIIAKGLNFKYHRCPPPHLGKNIQIEPFKDLWDIYGIILKGYTHIDIGIHYRSNSFGERYLPLADVRTNKIFDYARAKITLNDIINYARIGILLEGKNYTLSTLNYFSKMPEKDKISYIKDCIVLSILSIKHKIIKDIELVV